MRRSWQEGFNIRGFFDDQPDGESFLVVDLAWDGLGLVCAGSFYVVFGNDSGDGVEVDSAGAGGDYVGDGNDADFCRFQGGVDDAEVGGLGSGGAVFDHAFDRVECGDFVRAAGSI